MVPAETAKREKDNIIIRKKHTRLPSPKENQLHLKVSSCSQHFASHGLPQASVSLLKKKCDVFCHVIEVPITPGAVNHYFRLP